MILDQYGNPIKIEKSAMTKELATFSAATGSGYDILPDPDPVLRKRGDDATVLDALAADDQVTMAMQLRKRKVTNKGNYDYTPGQPEKGISPSKNAMELCRGLIMDLAGIKLKNAFNAFLSSNFYGYSVIELYWAVERDRYRLIHMQEKPRSWFTFSGRGELLFIANGQKLPVPYGKFLVVRHEPTYENPFGLRLLSRCLWAVAFKRSGVEWCMKYMERYGLAWQIAKAPSNFTEQDRLRLASSLAAMVQDAVAVLPHGAEHQIVSGGYEGGASGFLDFLNFWNAAISKVLSCQTQSSEITGSIGGFASSKIHYEVLEDVAEADEQLVCDAMNDLAVIYARVNGSLEYPPVFAYTEADDHMAQADLDKKRHEVGVRFNKAHFERQGLSVDEFELAPEPASQPPMSFARAGFTEDQEALEGLADDSLARAAKGVGKFQDALMAVVESASGFEDLVKRLEEAFPDASLGEFEDVLGQAMTAAQMFGRYQVILEGEE